MHFFFRCTKSHLNYSVLWIVAQLCLALFDSMDCSPLSMGILQARILEWIAIPFSRGSSQLRDWTQVSHIASRSFAVWATREAQEYWGAYSFSRGPSWPRNWTGVFCITGGFFLPAELSRKPMIGIYHCVNLRCATWWFDTYLCCEMITTVKLISKSVSSHTYLYFFMTGITFKIYSQQIWSIQYSVVRYSHYIVL